MHEIIGFSSMLFSQNPIWGKGKKREKKKETNLLAADSNCQFKNQYQAISTTKLQQFEQPHQ